MASPAMSSTPAGIVILDFSKTVPNGSKQPPKCSAKNASVTATSLRGRPDSEKAAICAQVERNVWPWVHAGVVRPIIDRVLPLKDAAYAHTLLADGAVTGKVVLSNS